MLRPPTWGQLGVLLLFGAVQLGFPYFLMAKALRVVTPAEAGTLSLVEPVLTPLWAYLVSREVPNTPTFVGGGIILAGLAWRYSPLRDVASKPKSKPNATPPPR